MALRITQDTLYRTSLLYLQKGLQRLDNAQQPLLTGKRIGRPSDDPFGTVRVLKFREEQHNLENYLSNNEMVKGLLESGATALQSVSNLMAEVKSIAVQGASSTLNQEDRNTLASQIEHSLVELVSLANTHFGGRFLFGGTETTVTPYTYDGQNTVRYDGNDEVSYTWISPGTRIAMNIPGTEIFQKREREPTQFQGDTGAAPGSGSDSGIGNDTLTVTHDTTTYAGASGVAAGTGSAAGDTILGTSGTHTLTLNVGTPATTGTVVLDGGQVYAFDTATDPAPDNFMVTNEYGDRVYLDLTGLAAGFSGTVDITSTGRLSTDGGVTTLDIDFSANQVVHDSATGTVTNVDSSAITRTGEEYITYTGTFDIFETLMALRDDLKNTRGLSTDEQQASIMSRILLIDDTHNDVLASLAEFGGRSLRLDMTKNRLEDFRVTLLGLVADIEEIDITEGIMHLEQASYGLELAQMVTNQILKSSLTGQLG
jgi:flagellar hook-associated protein 3